MSYIFTLEMFEDELSSSDNKRFFVHIEHGHYKYYIVNTDIGTCQYGRIGARPVEVYYHKNDLEKKVREKLRKGYREIFSKDDLDKYKLDGF